MLLPKKVPHRKVRIGKNEGNATRGNYVAFGDYGLQSLDNERITSRQIESARQAMTRYIKRGGKIWIRIFPESTICNSMPRAAISFWCPRYREAFQKPMRTRSRKLLPKRTLRSMP